MELTAFIAILQFFIGFKIVEGKIDYIKSNLNSNDKFNTLEM